MNKSLSFLLSGINKLVPKSDKKIAIYGRRMLNDNAEALLDYIISRKYNDRYIIYVLIHKNILDENVKYKNVKNVYIYVNPLMTFYVMFRALRVFHTQGTSRCAMRPQRGQIIFNLWHGSPLKAIGGMIGDKKHPETDSYFLSASPFFAEINEKCFGHTQQQMFIGSNPRNDLLFNPRKLDLLSMFGVKGKLVLCMPTFRNSSGLGKNDANKDFPLLSADNISTFDDYLEGKNLTFIIKPHPYQNKIAFLKKEYKNIKVIYNEDLWRLDIRLYELLSCSDALITDFSSVYFDYLLLNRPIGFAIDDLDCYKNNRGYTVDNPLKLMPGPNIKNLDELKMFITDVVNECDSYVEERRRINNIANTYKTGDACQRILDFVGIK